MILAWSLLLISLAPTTPAPKPASVRSVTTAATGIQRGALRGALLDPFAERGQIVRPRRAHSSSLEDKGLKDPFAAPPKRRRTVATAPAPKGALLDPFSVEPGVRAAALRISDELKDPFSSTPKRRPTKRKVAPPSPPQVQIQRPQPPSSPQVQIQRPQLPSERERCQTAGTKSPSPCPAPSQGEGPS